MAFVSLRILHLITARGGYDIANADAVVSIDSDLQHPPETIPQMLQSWRENGNNIVFGVRKYDDKTGWFKRTSSRYFYRLLNKISDINLIEGAADFRLIDRNVLRYLKQYREKSRFIRGIIGNMGFRHDAVMYDEEPRTAGAVKYNLLVMMKFALAGILSFSSFPLRIVIATGMLISMLSIFYATWIITEKVIYGIPPGLTSVLVGIFFIGGVQLISIGILGEYITNIFQEVKSRPLYCVSEVINHESPGQQNL